MNDLLHWIDTLVEDSKSDRPWGPLRGDDMELNDSLMYIFRYTTIPSSVFLGASLDFILGVPTVR